MFVFFIIYSLFAYTGIGHLKESNNSVILGKVIYEWLWTKNGGEVYFFFHISTCSCCQHPLKRISSFFFVLLLILNSIIRSIIHKDNERRADNNPLMKIFENHHIAITVFTHIVRRLANHGAQVVWRHWRHAIWLAYLSTLWCDEIFGANT